MESLEKYAIGIDLGTTNSCVGVWRKGKVEIIPNELGDFITPSIVGFRDIERVKGKSAKNQMITNFKNTIYGIKRLIGRRFSDREVKNDIELFPFEVISSNDNIPLIEVEYHRKKKQLYPEQISGILLNHLKKFSEDNLGCKITDAVITVPARFNDSQRQATINAGKIAGLNILKIINEPTAAAINYKIEKDEKLKEKKNVCIFDLGGGTFDITIFEIDNNKLKVLTTGGDTHLGGEDFDNELMKFLIQKIKSENGIDISNDQKSLKRLKFKCEEIKMQLSYQYQLTIDFENFAGMEVLSFNITRTDFELCCNSLFTKCINILKNTLEEIKMTPQNINEIILVGGSTRIPKIKQLLGNLFTINKLKTTINPDQAIAYGAAFEAAMLTKKSEMKDYTNFEIVDVTPHTLGISSRGGIMSTIIEKNTPIPCKKYKKFRTIYDYATYFGIGVYEGENKYVIDNYNLDNFILDNIRKDLKGKVIMKVTFSINKNSILEVTAEEENNNNCKKITIKREKGNNLDINKLIEDEEEMKKSDIEEEKKRTSKYELKSLLSSIIQDINNNNSELYHKAVEMDKWLKKSENENSTIYESKIMEIKNIMNKS